MNATSGACDAKSSIDGSDDGVYLRHGAVDAGKPASDTLVQKDGIVETCAGGAQIELGADSIIALGPQPRLYLS